MPLKVPPIKDNDWNSVRQAIQKLASLKLDIIQSDLQASIDSVETIASDAASLASDNAIAIASVETIASDAFADASDNLIRIDSIETLASDNRVSIDSIETIASDNAVRIDSVEIVASDAAVLASDHIANDGTDHSFIDQDVTTSASPTFVDYGTVTVAAGTGYIKKTDSATGELVSFDWAEDNSVSLTDNSVNYVRVKYNGGSPVVDSTDDFNAINFHTEFVVGLVYREGTSVKILQAGNKLPDAQIRLCTQKFLRGIEHISGGTIGEKATRYVTSTAGIFYIGDTRIDTPVFDSSTENFEHYYYRDGAGGWSDAIATGQIDNVYYDDGSGTLAELTANRYGVHWVYISFEGKLSVVYGQGNYKYNEAVLAQPPSSIPDYLDTFAILAAKIVIQKNASSFTAIESAFVTVFVPETTFDHNDLASLQGGTSGEYYHLTSAQHTDLTDSDDCTIHYHSSDRDRANHTGTQLASTISDFDEAAQDAVGAILGNTASINFTYNDDTPVINATVVPGGVDHDSLANVHQDVNTSASPTFAGLTLTGNLTMPDGGTIGQAAGPLLTFDDTNNYLEITGCNVGIGTSTPGSLLDVAGDTEIGGNLDVTDEIIANSYIEVGGPVPGGLTGTGKFFISVEPTTGKTYLWCYGKDTSTRGEFSVHLRASDGSNEIIDAIHLTADGLLNVNTPTTHFTMGKEGAADLAAMNIYGTGDASNYSVFRLRNVNGSESWEFLFEKGNRLLNIGKLGTNPGIKFTFKEDGAFIIHNIKSGATQAGAGAAAGELWKTSGHASLPDNVVMIGV